ncbi:hypothetical protein CONPUDRAFT_153633 [Coniophora puteana RWD-64-598 SS2]|uniref:Uncharacterized protein n=1 Tax=Coniophora puteana (strain RWD-64-598) TaxID=741705 RepID=A0A5M3MPN3_CONPW|nr:uncharacterized protein CONPUDRAFT_153633 [Coniophora puteana RWD-64-598 SS2]EIW81083.1 hypothetical protein CONPUDRAFT_153633 [Coniophora puteana RWD-64-598 SS2]
MASNSSSGSGSGAPPAMVDSTFADGIRLIGTTTVAGTFYGLMTVLAATCVQVTLTSPCGRRSRSRMAVLIGYIGLLWLCATLILAGFSRQIEEAYVQHRFDGPGPAAYNDQTSPESKVVDVADWLLSVLVHGMMTWRIKITWQSSRAYPYIMFLMIALYLGSSAITAIGVIFDMLPNHDIFTSPAANGLTVAGLLTGTLLTVVATALMAGRIWYYRRRFKKQIGNPHPKQYTKIAPMAVESCAIVTVSDIVFITLLLIRHPAMYLVIAVLPQLQVIGPLLLMLRIARGVAWDATTASTIITREHDVAELGAIRRGHVAGSYDPSRRMSLKFARHEHEHEMESDDAGTYDETEEGKRS